MGVKQSTFEAFAVPLAFGTGVAIARLVTGRGKRRAVKAKASRDERRVALGKDSRAAKLFDHLAKYHQEHLLDCWADLDKAQRDQLDKQLRSFDLEFVQRAFPSSMAVDAVVSGMSPEPVDVADVAPIAGRDPQEAEQWRLEGLRLISTGKVAVILLAGGQGTRLGSAAPKGCFDIGLPSGKPLFQLHAERIAKLQRLAADEVGPNGPGGLPDKLVHWYIMTSPATDRATREHFKGAAYYGLSASQVHFFQQATMPCLTPEGDMILETPGRVATAPDGNGGLYQALAASGALADMRSRGVECVDAFCVDNALAQVASPEWLGYCRAREADVGARVVAKSGPGEKVGVFVKSGASGIAVKEYSELGQDLAGLKGPGGQLVYRWGNICMHYFSLKFLESTAKAMRATPTYHVARKKIPCVGGDKVDGIKLEQFIFDPFPSAGKCVLFEVRREAEFAPVKNAPGEAVDSPDTARAAVLALHKKWVEAAGGQVVSNAAALSKVLPEAFYGALSELPGVEVAPTLSYAGEGLERLCKGKQFKLGTHIDSMRLVRQGSSVGKSKNMDVLDAPRSRGPSARTSKVGSRRDSGAGLKELVNLPKDQLPTHQEK
ncbi:unnamed protein product [Pedinophyceae sp. YPF-701]|nr:unnamed protein product [Pedinophyceae sp. YPF-701]